MLSFAEFGEWTKGENKLDYGEKWANQAKADLNHEHVRCEHRKVDVPGYGGQSENQKASCGLWMLISIGSSAKIETVCLQEEEKEDGGQFETPDAWRVDQTSKTFVKCDQNEEKEVENGIVAFKNHENLPQERRVWFSDLWKSYQNHKAILLEFLAVKW